MTSTQLSTGHNATCPFSQHGQLRAARFSDGLLAALEWMRFGGGGGFYEAATRQGWVFIEGTEGLPGDYAPGARVLQMRNELDPPLGGGLRRLFGFHGPIDDDDTVLVLKCEC
jgi:hypothetical protein